MAVKIQPQDTPQALAQRLLGDARMVHELVIPGWNGSGPLPVGKLAYVRSEQQGPPAKRWTRAQ